VRKVKLSPGSQKLLQKIRSTRISNHMKDSVRFSIRCGGIPSSISLKKNLISLWLVLSDNHQEKGDDNIQEIYKYIYNCLDTWKEDNLKGFSSFVSTSMIRDLLDTGDFTLYSRVITSI